MLPWLQQFGYLGIDKKDGVQKWMIGSSNESLVVSILSAGTFFGALLAAPTAGPYTPLAPRIQSDSTLQTTSVASGVSSLPASSSPSVSPCRLLQPIFRFLYVIAVHPSRDWD